MLNDNLSIPIIENPNKDISYEILCSISERFSCSQTEISANPLVDAICFPHRLLDGVVAMAEH